MSYGLSEVKIITGRLSGDHVIGERYFWRVEERGISISGGFAATAISALIAATKAAAKLEPSYAWIVSTLEQANGQT